jgi:mono/diheme cytochrome c family protein
MRKILFHLIVIAGSLFFLSSCYYDNEEELYGTVGVPCDSTGTVSYSQKVKPLFEQKCYSCHATTTPSGGITMGTYEKDAALAATGKLYGSIAYLSGYVPMPQGTNKMSDCQIAIVRKWIEAGTPNN